ncbi:UNVERIFIED_CONTAM: hypothetical protein Sradi_3282700 [Sesamum radiatum]|uniref:Uncharacterized protein n=1 Tax=Sesamum radiatum TaxID=300843 RepID=A0AAW2R048_SESRA
MPSYYGSSKVSPSITHTFSEVDCPDLCRTFSSCEGLLKGNTPSFFLKITNTPLEMKKVFKNRRSEFGQISQKKRLCEKMETSALNPNAPIFVLSAYLIVEDFSDEWWDLVQSSPWFHNYWLRACSFDFTSDDVVTDKAITDAVAKGK